MLSLQPIKEDFKVTNKRLQGESSQGRQIEPWRTAYVVLFIPETLSVTKLPGEQEQKSTVNSDAGMGRHDGPAAAHECSG